MNSANNIFTNNFLMSFPLCPAVLHKCVLLYLLPFPVFTLEQQGKQCHYQQFVFQFPQTHSDQRKCQWSADHPLCTTAGMKY